MKLWPLFLKNSSAGKKRTGMFQEYRVSQKFVPLISCTITFDQNFIFT